MLDPKDNTIHELGYEYESLKADGKIFDRITEVAARYPNAFAGITGAFFGTVDEMVTSKRIDETIGRFLQEIHLISASIMLESLERAEVQ